MLASINSVSIATAFFIVGKGKKGVVFCKIYKLSTIPNFIDQVFLKFSEGKKLSIIWISVSIFTTIS